MNEPNGTYVLSAQAMGVLPRGGVFFSAILPILDKTTGVMVGQRCSDSNGTVYTRKGTYGSFGPWESHRNTPISGVL